MALSLARPRDEPHDHGVLLYDEFADIGGRLADFVAEGLDAAEAAVIIATPPHRDLFERSLGDRVDLERARAEGRFVALDAAATIETFRVDGRIDPDRFHATIGSVLDAAGRDDRPVRAFGEMVALLWDEGDRWAAIDLEALWNEIGQDHLLSLRCAYPMASLRRSGDLRAIHAVCSHHTDVDASAHYRAEDDSAWLAAHAERSELFVADPLAIRAVRRFVVGAVDDDEEVAGAAALVASELASNVVRHVGSPFRVTVRRSSGTITIAVEDLGTERPVRVDPAATAIDGRGFTILDALCARWGTDLGPTGKVVWAELGCETTQG